MILPLRTDRLVFGLATIISFGISMYFLLVRESASLAGVTAAIFVTCALLVYLPELESIRAFGVEAKLRARLSESEDLLEKLRKLATVNAGLAYQQLAWIGQWGSPSVATKQQLASKVDRIVSDLELDAGAFSALKAEYIRLSSNELVERFIQLVRMRANGIVNRLRAENRSAADPTVSKRISELQELANSVVRGLKHEERFRSFVERALPHELLDPEDISRMKTFGLELACLAEAAEATGQVPPEMCAILDNHQMTPATRYRSIFGEEPSGL